MNALLRKQLAEQTQDDPRWKRVQARDATADGRFVYSVKTTGVYCRPSCAARPARPENVAFHDSPEAARRAGFRACKRCKPDATRADAEHVELVTAACRLIEAHEQMPTLSELAAKIGMSESHFHRVFKSVTGLTPRQYAVARRSDRMREQLDGKSSVTGAIVDAGYGSSSRFYEQAGKVLGMTPTQYRSGGSGQDIRFAVGECSLGSVLVAASGKGICAILLGDDPDALARDLQDQFPKANLIGADASFEERVARVVGLIEAPGQAIDLPLDIRGTAFQQRVWTALKDIPPSTTVCYSELAERIGAPKSARAVAQACAANKLAVAIPCHRVIRNDGALSGYRWGVERKKALLDREASA